MSGFFQKLGWGLKKTSQNLSQGITDIFTKESLSSDVITDLEELLYTADVGVKATSEIVEKFTARRFDKNSSIEQIKQELTNDIISLIKPSEQEFVIDKSKKPFVILMVGVNGAGKTTTIGKLGKKFSAQGYQVSFIAADTFRAAAVEQLAVWGSRHNLRVFSGPAGCDSAGLCFDGLKEAEKRGDDIVFIDTAGRLQNKKGLMEELQKIVRVIKKVSPDAPHKTLITIDAATGQNGLDQVKTFKELVDVNGVIITKLDGSSKGGILIAVASETGIPVYFVGVGEQAEDMDVFKAEDFAKGLLGL
ncbi:MAG: signal recognition particle-docking protein FtsY [Alphaproteobacteria bacterium]|nr:signal recognition particle-docking protein FtsY [Alphaproteobacteria bacterium]MBO5442099.1 signal recognition particle-docking protein FtsY [Alphaproteobacteria bacterium]